MVTHTGFQSHTALTALRFIKRHLDQKDEGESSSSSPLCRLSQISVIQSSGVYALLSPQTINTEWPRAWHWPLTRVFRPLLLTDSWRRSTCDLLACRPADTRELSQEASDIYSASTSFLFKLASPLLRGTSYVLVVVLAGWLRYKYDLLEYDGLL